MLHVTLGSLPEILTCNGSISGRRCPGILGETFLLRLIPPVGKAELYWYNGNKLF